MKKLLYFLIIFLLGILFYEMYCRYHFTNVKNDFIEMNEENDLKAFRGYDFTFRGCNRNGDYVVSVNMNNSNYYIIKCDKTGQLINKVDSLRGKINQDSLKQLLPAFMSMNISRLRVDYIGNVLIYIDDYEKETLVRFFNDYEKKVFINKVGFKFWNEHYDSLSGLWFEYK